MYYLGSHVDGRPHESLQNTVLTRHFGQPEITHLDLTSTVFSVQQQIFQFQISVTHIHARKLK